MLQALTAFPNRMFSAQAPKEPERAGGSKIPRAHERRKRDRPTEGVGSGDGMDSHDGKAVAHAERLARGAKPSRTVGDHHRGVDPGGRGHPEGVEAAAATADGQCEPVEAAGRAEQRGRRLTRLRAQASLDDFGSPGGEALRSSDDARSKVQSTEAPRPARVHVPRPPCARRRTAPGPCRPRRGLTASFPPPCSQRSSSPTGWRTSGGGGGWGDPARPERRRSERSSRRRLRRPPARRDADPPAGEGGRGRPHLR